jgi:hypothetical protein
MLEDDVFTGISEGVAEEDHLAGTLMVDGPIRPAGARVVVVIDLQKRRAVMANAVHRRSSVRDVVVPHDEPSAVPDIGPGTGERLVAVAEGVVLQENRVSGS